MFVALSCSVSARPIEQHARGQSQETSDPTTELRRAGLKEYRLGHFAEAQRLLENALVLAEQRRDMYTAALIHDSLGSIYQDKEEFIKAGQEFNKAVAILRTQPEHYHALAMSLANFGVALCGGRRYKEALTVLSEASKLVKDHAINDLQLQVHILNVSGTSYLWQGQSKKAEALFRQALRMSSLPENAMVPEAADSSNNLGTLYARKGDYPKAIASFTLALEIGEKYIGANHPNITMILRNLGFTYMRMGRNGEAEPHLLRSLAILEDQGLMKSTLGMATLYGLGQISIARNQLERAQTLLARAVETGRSIGARTPEMAETLDLYSNLLRTLSKRTEAENVHAEAALIRAQLALTTRVGP
jgi:tetratricopeptide (TPR) repeat protein